MPKRNAGFGLYIVLTHIAAIGGLIVKERA